MTPRPARPQKQEVGKNNDRFLCIAEYTPVDELVEKYPIVKDFLANMNFGALDTSLPLADAIERADRDGQDWIEELGTDADDALQQLADFLSTLSSPEDVITHLDSITIAGGRDKSGTPENIELTVHSGEVLSIVGPTAPARAACSAI